MKKLIWAAVAVIFTAGCGSEQADKSMAAEAAPAEKTAAQAADSEIELSAAQVKTAGIELGSTAQKQLADGLDVAAELTLHADDRAVVSSFTDGILSEIKVKTNQKVAKGQVLAFLNKPDLLDAQRDFLENRDRTAFLRLEFDRFQKLKNEDATALKNFQKAEAELRAAETTSKLLAARLRQFQIDPDGLTVDNLRTRLALTAPISGTVTRLTASVGQSMAMGSSMAELLNLDRLHIDVFLLEKDVARVRAGQNLTLWFPSDPTRRFAATIESIDATVDPDRKAVRAHARLANGSSAGLVDGAALAARLPLGTGSAQLAAPDEAIIRERDGSAIFVFDKKDAEGRQFFQKTRVKAGPSAGGWTAIEPLSPLAADAKIVVKGAYYVSAQGAGVSAEE